MDKSNFKMLTESKIIRQIQRYPSPSFRFCGMDGGKEKAAVFSGFIFNSEVAD
jgi:hypothetical protein